MTEYGFWEAYKEYLHEKVYTPGTVFNIEYCNNDGITRNIPIDNAVESKVYPGCFEADCFSSYYYDEMIDAPVTTSHRTFSYNNVKKTYLG